MKTSIAGQTALIADEGEVLTAYPDIVGVMTIGVGLTAKSGVITPTRGMTITRAESRRLLELALERNYEPAVNAMLPGVKQHEFDGAVSFHYNTGAIRTATWVSRFKAGLMSTARTSFLSWNKAQKKVVRGLTLRREREWKLISEGVYPHGITPDVVEPAAAAPTVVEEPIRVLRIGSEGEKIVDLQRRLQALKLYDGSLDGKFGPKTEKAVMAFQKLHPILTVDGIAGPATIAQLTRVADVTKKSVVYAAASSGATAISAGTMPEYGMIGVGIAGVLALGWLAYRYRDDLVALWKLKTGAA